MLGFWTDVPPQSAARRRATISIESDNLMLEQAKWPLEKRFAKIDGLSYLFQNLNLTRKLCLAAHAPRNYVLWSSSPLSPTTTSNTRLKMNLPLPEIIPRSRSRERPAPRKASRIIRGKPDEKTKQKPRARGRAENASRNQSIDQPAGSESRNRRPGGEHRQPTGEHHTKDFSVKNINETPNRTGCAGTIKKIV